jgi:hypothetical protein
LVVSITAGWHSPSAHPAACGRNGRPAIVPAALPGDPGGASERGQAQLADDVAARDHAVTGDVAAPGRSGAHDAGQQRLADVVLVHELDRKVRHGRGYPDR